jgi:hypothetical protein
VDVPGTVTALTNLKIFPLSLTNLVVATNGWALELNSL